MNRNARILCLCLSVLGVIYTTSTYAASYTHQEAEKEYRPYYFGALLGYGTTTWDYLVSDETDLTVPEHVNEGGVAGGAFFGYEFNKHFAVEGLYVYIPKATLRFADWSDYRDENDEPITKVRTRSHAFAFYGKFLVPILKTKARGFALAGVEVTNRKDILAHTTTRVGPVFGAGINYLFNERIMGEFGFNYFNGFAISKPDVVYDFIPFIYTIHFKLAYRF